MCFIPLLIDKYNDRIPSLLSQFSVFQIEFVRANCATPYLNLFCWGLYSSQLQGHSAQALVVLLYVFLSNVTNAIYIEELREMISPPNHNSVGVCNQITVYLLY